MNDNQLYYKYNRMYLFTPTTVLDGTLLFCFQNQLYVKPFNVIFNNVYLNHKLCHIYTTHVYLPLFARIPININFVKL